jgi:hypothetical protein
LVLVDIAVIDPPVTAEVGEGVSGDVVITVLPWVAVTTTVAATELAES